MTTHHTERNLTNTYFVIQISTQVLSRISKAEIKVTEAQAHTHWKREVLCKITAIVKMEAIF